MDATKIGISVECAICKRTKIPRGRSASPEIAMSWCVQPFFGEGGCGGYEMEPRVGDLWPGETDEDFGYPCSDLGTRPLTEAEIAQRAEEVD